jgi:hypothetical protein
MKQILVAALCAGLIAAPAQADESWTSSIGTIVYEAEVDGVAIFTYPLPDLEGGVGRLYFPGLAGNYDNRGTHPGYWIAPGDTGGCSATSRAIRRAGRWSAAPALAPSSIRSLLRRRCRKTRRCLRRQRTKRALPGGIFPRRPLHVVMSLV